MNKRLQVKPTPPPVEAKNNEAISPGIFNIVAKGSVDGQMEKDLFKGLLNKIFNMVKQEATVCISEITKDSSTVIFTGSLDLVQTYHSAAENEREEIIKNSNHLRFLSFEIKPSPKP